MGRVRVLFTDLDGTCVHYDWHEWGAVAPRPDPSTGLWECTSLAAAEVGSTRRAALLRLPPSTSGAQGVISLETLRLYAALRQLGVKIVVITGARLATLLARLPYIPAADAFVCEGGGRIFYPTPAHELPTAAPLAEDLAWRELQAAAAGPAGQDGVPPEDREGTLWRFYAQIQQQAAALGGKQLRADAASYTTAFRLKGAPDVVAAALSSLPPTLTTAVNLGAADVFPATSGKDKAAIHLMQRFGAAPADCAFMCDDDNDLQLAHLVGRAYLPAITADSVAQAVAAAPEHFHVAQQRGVFAAEDVLRLLVAQQMGD